MGSSIRGDHRAHPHRRDVHDRTAVLDGANSRDGELLDGLVRIAERGVVGLDQQNVGPVVDGVAHQGVVGHLEADD
ncbi:MAG: hypothetical protein QOF35_1759, partial [Actinomycetota bacterium]|nr:hypothetical protein [Actinomycetota bacterium]